MATKAKSATEPTTVPELEVEVEDEEDDRTKAYNEIIKLIDNVLDKLSSTDMPKKDVATIKAYTKSTCKKNLGILLRPQRKQRKPRPPEQLLKGNNLATPKPTEPEFQKYVMELQRDGRLGKLDESARKGYEIVTKHGISSILLNYMIYNVDVYRNKKLDNVQLYTTPFMDKHLKKIIERTIERTKDKVDKKGNPKPFDPKNFSHAKINCMAAVTLNTKTTLNATQKALLEDEDTRTHLSNFHAYLHKLKTTE